MSVVLVVDDDPVSLQLLDLILHRGGFEVILADTAALGLEMLSRSLPDLIMIDDMMPEMNGGEMCRRIKDDPVARGVPVILISAGLRIQDQRYIRDVGADAVLLKPTLTQEVLDAVTLCLEKHA